MKNSYPLQDKKYLKAFGARVRALCKAARYSQEDFALEIGLDRTYMDSVERGSAIWPCLMCAQLPPV